MSEAKSRGPLRAPRGTELSCQGWVQEAALRMLLNNLDPEVAERPEDLVVYGGTGKAARNWPAFDGIVKTLKRLKNDETLLVQSGKAVGVMKSHPDAPRVLIANSNLVGKWATWEHFGELERRGLMMYGQMTAGSWIYIGTQGILQGTYETFVAASRKHYGTPSLKGKIILTGGLGGMGGAQPLAATMAGAACLAIEIDRERAERRIETRYLDEIADDLADGIARVSAYAREGIARSVCVIGNCAEVLPQLLEVGFKPDLLTDQTSAHDPLNGYVPAGLSLTEADELRESDPKGYVARSKDSMRTHVEAMLAYLDDGVHVFDYGNNIRAMATDAGCERAFDFPGFVPAYIRPLFCEGKGPFRWCALSGDPEDIYTTDRALLELFPEDEALRNWIEMAQQRVAFQGLPCRICWLGYGEREKAGRMFNELVRTGKVKAPIVVGRDHLDCGSVASPNRETEGMIDGSDAVGDWPILNAMINAVNGASWVSFHHGGGVGMGYSLHAGMVVVADGTEEADKRLSRVLQSDPGMGVIRHADAGYDIAVDVAHERGVDIPGITS